MKTMVCYDASAAANHALHIAKKRADKLGADIFLVSSFEGGRESTQADYDRAEKLLEKARADVEAQNIPCEVLLSVNRLNPGENLCRIAENKNVDDVYIGVRKRSRVGKPVFGSTTRYVILHAPCPVVTVK